MTRTRVKTMTKRRGRHRAERTLTALFVLLASATVAAAVALAGDGALPPELQDVRAAVARYHSFEQAQSDGYTLRAGEPCVRSPIGTMGYHVANAALMADDAIDPLRPELLLYTADQNGSLKLVGVEYWKRDSDGSLATADDRPTLFGQPFDGPMPGHNPTMPVHYDLHAWVAEQNPSGVFAMFNPNLSCP
jgi:hypothetical protein